MQRRIALGAGAALLVAITALTVNAACESSASLRDRGAGRVVSAIDSSTLRIAMAGGNIIDVKLLGLRVPDDWQPAAHAYLHDQAVDRAVMITLDGIAAYVYTDADVLINEAMVRDGYAIADESIDHALGPWLIRLTAWAKRDGRPRAPKPTF